MLLIVFSQLGVDGVVEELDVILDTEIVEKIFRQRELYAHVWPADRKFESYKAIRAAPCDADIATRQGGGVGVERNRLLSASSSLICLPYNKSCVCLMSANARLVPVTQ
jgi:hypothetical protein